MAKKKTKVAAKVAKAKSKARTVKTSTVETKARVLKERIKKSGKSTRTKGHLSASTRRSQAKRDTKRA